MTPYFEAKRLSLSILLILGAQKSGTTSLFDLLCLDSAFCGSRVKETGFFSKNIFYNKGMDWYLSQFENYSENSIRFEATPEYLYYPYVAERVYRSGYNYKFIVIFREPAARCYSAWNMFKTFNKSCPNEIFNIYTQFANPKERESIKELLFTKDYPTFKKAVLDDMERYKKGVNELEPSFVRRGIYYDQISNWLKFFKKEDFLFFEQSELINTLAIQKRIGCFLQIPNHKVGEVSLSISNKGIYNSERSEEENETLAMLKTFFRPHNEKLFNLVGERYDWDNQ
ncbi:sulfotransferase domain-containing protein [Desulforamulus ruminis]|uniref:sulfotransferase domain-containing protein n=1 Tax=Desulforamulus ruminis TaxID=1564 RepID=UPI002FDA254B